MHKFMIFTGVLTILFSAFFITAATTDLLSESDPEVETLLAVIVFFSMTGILGFYLAIAHFFRNRRKEKEQKERQILKVIASKGGRVTPVEIAAETNLIIDEAKAALDQLCKSGAGQLQVTENGNMVYVFEGVLSSQEKNTAKSPLDVKL